MHFQNLHLERDSLNTKISFQINELVMEKDLLKEELNKKTIEVMKFKDLIIKDRKQMNQMLNQEYASAKKTKDIQQQERQKYFEELMKLRRELAEAKRELKAIDDINKQQEEDKVERFAEVLKCVFDDHYRDDVGVLYSCIVTSLNNQNNNKTITGYSGVHLTHKNDNDVKAIYISGTNTEFIPKNLGLLFNLTVFGLWNTRLNEIKSIDFNGMQELKHLFLKNNGLSSLPAGVFSNLPNLKTIDLSDNKIEELVNGLFDNNLNLEEINVNRNRINFIATGLVDKLTKLVYVDLGKNFILYKIYRESSITQLKDDIKKSNNK